MNRSIPSLSIRTRRFARLAATFKLTGFALAFCGAAAASPGAHGPNGEHLDGPPAAVASGTATPRLEAHSEMFEIVGHLAPGELSLFINRYDSNEPVLGAKVDVELGGLKAAAPFHADAGDYAISDAVMLAALGKPGRHALVFTVTAGADADLLDGILTVGVTAPAPASTPAAASIAGTFDLPKAAWLALPAAALAYALLRRRGQRRLAASTLGAPR